jgi:SAM-dependent methyltransferase
MTDAVKALGGWLVTQWHRVRTIARLVAAGDAAELVYSYRNRKRRLDLEFVSVDDLGLSHDKAHFYSNSGGPHLHRVFKQVRIPPGSVGLDLGCGKGGALFSMSAFPFAELVGVDLSSDLIHVAQSNAARLGIRHVRFVHADATTFTDLDAVTHIYMYNPFPCVVVQRVMDNVAASVTSVPRDVVLVYKHPKCHEQIMASGVFEKVSEAKLGVHWWYVYRHTGHTGQ